MKIDKKEILKHPKLGNVCPSPYDENTLRFFTGWAIIFHFVSKVFFFDLFFQFFPIKKLFFSNFIAKSMKKNYKRKFEGKKISKIFAIFTRGQLFLNFGLRFVKNSFWVRNILSFPNIQVQSEALCGVKVCWSLFFCHLLLKKTECQRAREHWLRN